MRALRVVTNETCGMRCTFCDSRRDHERSSVATGTALRDRVLDAVHAKPEAIVFTGGEPTRRQDLTTLVAFANARTSATLVLETNAVEFTDALPHRLADAGLDVIRIHFPGFGAALEETFGRPDLEDRMTRGLQACLDSPLRVELATAVVASNVASVASIPQALRDRDLEPDMLWARIPWASPNSLGLAPMTQAAAAVERIADAARRTGLAVGLLPDGFLPPCAFPRPHRVAHMFALNRGGASRRGYAQRDACRECSLRDRCPGPPIELEVEGVPAPLTDDRLRRRLTVISTPQAQIERELVTHEQSRRPDGTVLPSATIRINFRCNQHCSFCFVSTHLPDPELEAVEAAIDAIGAQRGVVALSGGEPTLNPRLVSYIRRAKAAGVTEVELQTNATRLGNPTRVAELAAADLDVAFVSLHGASAEVSDQVTESPGTFAQTLAGLDSLAASSISLRINFVLCQLNYREFPQFVTLVATRWPAASITISFVGASTDLVPKTAALIPRYDDLMPQLAEGLRRAAEAKVSTDGFASMCGIPLCLVPGDAHTAGFETLAILPAGAGDGEFLKPDECTRCVLEPRCFGIRRGYADLYGTSELKPRLAR